MLIWLMVVQARKSKTKVYHLVRAFLLHPNLAEDIWAIDFKKGPNSLL
jgi:hypothetical protein